MNTAVKHLLFGLASYTPLANLISKNTSRKTGGGGGSSDLARYCYSVWLRHLVSLFKHGNITEMPKVIAELGPGNSIGVGIAALLSGANHYYAFDVVEYSLLEKNIEILDELISLFKRRESIPDDLEFPKIKPKLASYDFPQDILSEDILNLSLSDDRLNAIRNALLGQDTSNMVSIKYCASWNGTDKIVDKSVDLIFSQAVLEHVDDLLTSYKSMYKWLRPKGFMSHQIDFKCHGTANTWNGHWAYSDFWWKLIRGRRPYLLNREPYSTHVKLQEEVGFKILNSIKVQGDNCGNISGINRVKLARRFINISDEDLCTSGAYITSVKRTI
ncbi:MAG: methyltransferase domain-containing protein [Oligoflexia bacterium]|nr:methyltransferase domain-containing protein [Oligoflexia bacterium]